MSKHLKLEKISKSYGATKVIHGIDLEIEQSEFVVFVGPSGCGKSTMLRMIAGLEEISEGHLLINDERANDSAPVDRGVAMVFQSYALYPNMNVRQNLAFSLEQAKLPKDEIKSLVQDAAESLKIVPLLDRRPSQLSGGQSQRVAIGRAIVRKPDLFLFDEPLSNLDAELRVHMRVEIKALHHRLQRTMIYVTHDQVEAMTLADRIVVFNQGRIEQIGSPLDLYNAPVSKFVAGFIGSPKMNFLDFSTLKNAPIHAQKESFFADSAVPTDAVTLGVRPEHIKTCAPVDGLLVGEVLMLEQLGGESFLHLGVQGHPENLSVKLAGQSQLKVGERVGLTFDAGQVFQFDKQSGHRLGSDKQSA